MQVKRVSHGTDEPNKSFATVEPAIPATKASSKGSTTTNLILLADENNSAEESTQHHSASD